MFDGLIERARRFEPAAIGRLLSFIESAPASWMEIEAGLERPPAHDGDLPATRVIGLTGPPGAGKSTLLDKLLEALLARDLRVAVIAVDPSSPFSGGAVLGDRTRVGAVASDPRVFMRSVASRGAQGGLADSTATMLELLRRLRFPIVLLESVGAGQADLAIAALADYRVVLCPPGLGDDVQALKAGILEIADVLVVSKGDLPGSELTERELRSAVALGRRSKKPDVLRVSSSDGSGVAELTERILQR